MTPKQYKDARYKDIKNHPAYFSRDVRDDYTANDDIPVVWALGSPSVTGSYNEADSMAVLDYYYFWFPLVKASL
tara:strand:+ start:1525 stop:1746 length:222 start_codon:yes stop_codon:yes gene_type:complete